MFPYSDFAKGNKQSEKKFERQFAIAPNAKELTKEGIHSFPFYLSLMKQLHHKLRNNASFIHSTGLNCMTRFLVWLIVC